MNSLTVFGGKFGFAANPRGERENTLIEMKASCAGAIAARKKGQRAFEETRNRSNDWAAKAELAISKGREDLAREALQEKRRYAESLNALEREAQQLEDVVGQYQTDILTLEDKLTKAREKQRSLVQRHIHAQKKADGVTPDDRLTRKVVKLDAPRLPPSNPHSARGTTACHFPRFPSLEAFGRRPQPPRSPPRPSSAGIRNPSQNQPSRSRNIWLGLPLKAKNRALN